MQKSLYFPSIPLDLIQSLGSFAKLHELLEFKRTRKRRVGKSLVIHLFMVKNLSLYVSRIEKGQGSQEIDISRYKILIKSDTSRFKIS